MTLRTFAEDLERARTDRASRLEPLWRMTPAERILAMRRGDLTLEQCCAWAGRYPDQVPTLHGEFEFIATRTPELCE